MSAPQIIVLSFLAIILAGTLLLMLPIASRNGESCGFLTALFTATSSTCVTGLVLADTYTQWSGFGQSVLLVLIQVGGLGFMTVVSVFFFVLRARIGLRSRLLLSQSFGIDGVEGIVLLARHVLIRTLIFEAVGAAILTVRFCFDQPFLTALRWGIFHAVSAFCNAGFDILGKIAPNASLIPYGQDVTVNVTIAVLIVVGGLGFFVWEDIARFRKKRHLSVYTKLVLLMTTLLIVVGWLLYALLEWNNPETLGGLSTGQKLLASFFQSVTTRTAGYAAIDQGALYQGSKAVTIGLMLIGGSSGSTAGGIKTVTFVVALLGGWAAIRGKERVSVFRRSIDSRQIASACSVVFLMICLSFGAAVYLSASGGFSFVDALYETASAMGTVGLSTGITPLVTTGGKLILIVLMFFGRIGIATIGVGFMMGDRDESRYRYAPARILIG